MASIGKVTASVGNWGIAITRDGKNIYVTGTHRLDKFDRNITTGALTANGFAATGLSPTGVYISADDSNVYVANSNDNSISIFSRNKTTGALTANGTIAAGRNPQEGCVTEYGKNVYVVNHSEPKISIYSRSVVNGSLGFYGSILTGSSIIFGICASKDNKNVYVTDISSNVI
ncbi:MAG: lactonase family protein, partial [Leptospira sp.]|nr:lactonase family protein [Leptospira sp.]